MTKEMKWRIGIVVAALALTIFFAVPWADRPLFKGQMKYGLDLQGGTEILYRMKEMSPEQAKRYEGQDIAVQIMGIIRERVDAQGVKEVRIQKQGGNRILIQLPGADARETEALQKLIQTSGQMLFRLVATREEAEAFRDREPPSKYKWLEYSKKEGERELILMDDGWNLSGDIIKTAARGNDESGFPAVDFEIHRGSQDAFYELTSNNSDDRLGDGSGRKLAIVMDGKIISAPVIRSGIRDRGIITGGEYGFEVEEQARLITVLKYGSFPVDLDLEEVSEVGPGLGSDSIRKGITSIIVGAVIVLLFMAVYYLAAGLVANFALCFNLAIILASMNLLSATMSLPGIAGVLLTVGMAVDANILIFERIREEKAKGKTLHQAVKTGYDRAFVTIVDSNVTTLITSAILWVIGTGPVKGFAITLSIGILASMFTAIVVTRVIFDLLLMGRAITELRMLQMLKNPALDFVAWSRTAIIASAVSIGVGLLVFSYRGERNLGIDFREGTVVDFNVKESVPISQVRQKLAAYRRAGDASKDGPFANAEILELWKGIGDRSQTRSFEVRVGFAQKPEVVREDVKTVFGDVLAPAPFLPEKPEDGVTARQFLFKIKFKTTAEKRVADVEKELTRAFETHMQSAMDKSKPGELPGKLLASGVDTGRTYAKEFEFESATLPVVADGRNLIEGLTEFYVRARTEIEKGGELGVDGAFPRGQQQIERFADLNLKVNFLAAVPPDQVHEAFKTLKEVEIQPARGGADTASYTISAKGFRIVGESESLWSQRIRTWEDTIRKAIKDGKIASNLSEPISRSQAISPIIVSELIEMTIVAIIFSLIAIVVYVAIRFQVGGVPTSFTGSGFLNFIKEITYRARYGIAAIVALAHDVLFTVGTIAIAAELGLIEVKIDLQIIAAFLTIIGYSLNDTIVIFDRIRENLQKGDKRDFKEQVNEAVNQTLSRTILTAGTTFSVVLALFLLGGAVVQGLSFTLMIGVLIGTYSTVYIAAPILVFWERMVRPA